MALDIVSGHKGVHSEGEFAAALASERVRTERYGSRFSLLAFRPTESQMTGHQRRLLQVALRRRLRATDRVGWVDGGALMVLLPEADEAGARRVADDVFVRLARCASAISLSIQHYTPQYLDGLPRTGTE